MPRPPSAMLRLLPCHLSFWPAAFLTATPLLSGLSLPGSPASSSPDIRGIIPAQPYFLVPVGLLWTAIGLIVLLLAGWAWWYFFLRRRVRQPVPGPTPREIASGRLRELEREADALDPRRFGVEVCEILRAYIGAQFGLQVERQTSPEFLGSIIHANAFSGAQKTLLREFLEQCDLLKFARLEASAEAKRSLLAQADEFLQPAPASALQEVINSPT